MRDGIGVSLSVGMLSDDYSRLANNAKVPPGASYRAKAATKADFAHMAAAEIESGDIVDGYARYPVLRQQGAVLLAMINRSLGSSFHYYNLASC